MRSKRRTRWSRLDTIGGAVPRAVVAAFLLSASEAAGAMGANGTGGKSPAASPAAKSPARVVSSRSQLLDGWVASDAVVIGTYLGPDSTLGRSYHAIQVEDSWMGGVPHGKLRFKAPRGIRAQRDQKALLMLWDRLNGAPDSYLEESKRRYGARLAAEIGPDSLAAYLLPFSTYAYPLVNGKLALQTGSAFPTEIELGDLHKQLLDYEYTLRAPSLFRSADTVLHARVQRVDKSARTQGEIVVEHRITAHLQVLERWKGQAPDTLQLQFASYPRSPRFKAEEEVILFLSRADGRPFLAEGKRDVYHVENGTVQELRQPLAEFRKSLRGS